MTLSDHMDRAAGFAEVIKAEFPNLEIVGPVETNDDAEVVKQEVNRALATDPDIVAVYNLGAGNRGLIEALPAHRSRKLSVVVHELTANSRRALNDGLLTPSSIRIAAMRCAVPSAFSRPGLTD
jgi:LacI family transcriptional regulator